LWKNAEFRKKQKQSQIVAWNSEEKRQRSSKKIKELWKNDEYRKKQELVKLTDEWKETASERSKNRWKQSEYRNKFEMLWNDQNFLNQFSELAKELWEKDEYRKLQQDLWKDPDRIKKASEKSKEYWNDPENKQKISEKSKEYWNNPVHRKKSKEYWANPVNREKQAKARIEFLKSGKDSIIERISQNILGALNIEYQRHYRLGYYEFDLFIPSHDLLVECQGEYWHSLDKAKQNDASKFTYIDIYFPQYRILYLYERDFLNPGIVKQKLIRELFQNEYENQQIEFSFTDLEIRELSVKDKLEHYFYSAPEEFLQ
jgi:hypothetical protein